MAPAKHTRNSNAIPVAISVSLFTMEAFFSCGFVIRFLLVLCVKTPNLRGDPLLRWNRADSLLQRTGVRCVCVRPSRWFQSALSSSRSDSLSAKRARPGAAAAKATSSGSSSPANRQAPRVPMLLSEDGGRWSDYRSTHWLPSLDFYPTLRVWRRTQQIRTYHLSRAMQPTLGSSDRNSQPSGGFFP